MVSEKVASEVTLSFSGTVGCYRETVVGHVRRRYTKLT